MSHGRVRSSTFARLAQLAVPHVWGGGTSVPPRSQTTRDRHDVQTCPHPPSHTPARGGKRRTRSSFAPQRPGGSRARARRVGGAWASARSVARVRAARLGRPPAPHPRQRPGAHCGRNFEIAIFLSSPMLLVRGGTGEVEWRSDSLGKMLYGRARGSAGACVGEGAGGRARGRGRAARRRRPCPRATLEPSGPRGITSDRERPVRSTSPTCELGAGPAWGWAQGEVRADQGNRTELPGSGTPSSAVWLGVVHDQQRAPYDVGS